MMRMHGLLQTTFFWKVFSVQFTGPGGATLVDSSLAFSVSVATVSLGLSVGGVSML